MGYLLYLFVLADHLLAGDRVVFGAVVARVDNEFTEGAEATVSADGEERRVEERMILTKVIFTLRPGTTVTAAMTRQLLIPDFTPTVCNSFGLHC